MVQLVVVARGMMHYVFYYIVNEKSVQLQNDRSGSFTKGEWILFLIYLKGIVFPYLVC